MYAVLMVVYDRIVNSFNGSSFWRYAFKRNILLIVLMSLKYDRIIQYTGIVFFPNQTICLPQKSLSTEDKQMTEVSLHNSQSFWSDPSLISSLSRTAEK
jgi:hypothetical protein